MQSSLVRPVPRYHPKYLRYCGLHSFGCVFLTVIFFAGWFSRDTKGEHHLSWGLLKKTRPFVCVLHARVLCGIPPFSVVILMFEPLS